MFVTTCLGSVSVLHDAIVRSGYQPYEVFTELMNPQQQATTVHKQPTTAICAHTRSLAGIHGERAKATTATMTPTGPRPNARASAT
ncbi:hypothetical protein OHA72_23275 [Dactylosporangium sp. NBC_01737]|uniref:hypothetical protein n=1 Tax=Dactylosporangium sp. NBC_01737 TaxID=2975959 RepID=UPI002E127ECE|nr:hypothetical protein OHA72_23275 [Dactylosporangium sp. NBC_01737]